MAEVPILKEIKLNYTDENSIQKSFLSQFEVESPLYIDLSMQEKSKNSIHSSKVIQLIEDVIFDVEWYFYYPIYIISDQLENHRLFTIVRGISEIPEHFQKSIKNVKGRELLLLKKLKIIQGRLRTTQLNSRMELTKYQSDNLRTLKELNSELSFYDHIRKEIQRYKKEVI